MDVVHNLNVVREAIPENVNLVAVSKTKPAAMVQDLFRVGHLDFGENKVQDLVAKSEELSDRIRWHMIGHLQTNKVKYIAPFVYLIHAVDSLKLLSAINKEAQKNERIISCLFQVHIADEDTKFGLNEMELEEIITSAEFHQMNSVSIKGLMGMATFTKDSDAVRKEFQNLKRIFEKVKENHFKDNQNFSILSMGMSGDFPLAISEGSNMIRVGSSIFGSRY
ncbi:MAG: YggS family pyridoxal phosphate-dependent enzyme [Bacteroidales bacterium]|jgi:pyridoxal phosphate enzyme (YggS family)|nr:YggS family pyridoxal phosphate-dependent enzyme [Bacteroidales bacterium]